MNKKKVGKVIAVCAVAVLVTAIVIALNFFIPKHIFQEKIDKVTQMGDIQYSLEVTKTVGGDKNGVELAGFYLPTAKQFSANVAEIADGTKKDTSSIVIDNDVCYIDTRSLFANTGKYWLGDLDSAETYDKMYGEIFRTSISRFWLGEYSLPYWDTEERWVQELKSISDILNMETQTSVQKNGKFRLIQGGASMILNPNKFEAVATDIGKIAAINSSYIYDTLTRAAKAYGVSVGHKSGMFSESLTKWATQTSESRENNQEIGKEELYSVLTKWVEDVQTRIKTKDIKLTVSAYEADDALIFQAIAIGSDETFEVKLTLTPSYKTYLDNVPTEYEEFGVQIALLEDYFETAFDLDIPTINEKEDSIVPEGIDGTE